MTQSLNCPNCGAPLQLDALRDSDDDLTVTCPYCQSNLLLPDTVRTVINDPKPIQPVAWSMGNIFSGMGAAMQMAAALQQVQGLIAQGNKIEAIKLVRATFGLGLVEAKEAVEKLARGEAVNLSQVNMGAEQSGVFQAGETGNLKAEVQRLLAANQKIEAVKLMRETTGLGLKEAKDLVEQIERGEPMMLVQTSMNSGEALPFDATQSQALTERVQQLLAANRKIEAVKIVREATGLGLKEAKDLVEAIERGEPVLFKPAGHVTLSGPSVLTSTTRLPASGAGDSSGRLGCLLSAIILAAILLPVGIAIFSLAGIPLLGFISSQLNLNLANVPQPLVSSAGIGPGQLNDARYIGSAADGSIYVGSFSDGRIQRFSSSGEYLSLWQLEGEADEIYVTDMAVNRDGMVLVAYQGKLLRFDGANGSFQGLAVEIASDDYYTYFDQAAFAPDGSLVTVSSGEDLIVFDSDRRLKFSLEAAISTISNDSELDAKLAVDGLGNIYLAGSFNDAVFVYDASGRFITRFGSSGDENGQFRAIGDIAVDGYGRIYVSDIRGIQVFANDGRYLNSIDVDGYAYGLHITPANELLIVTGQPGVYRIPLSAP